MRVMGIRAEESVMRKNKPRMDKYNGKQFIVKPIFYWPEWAVWEFIETQKLPYPGLYDEGWNRIGCVFCPFIFGKGEAAQLRVKRYQERWPHLWKAFQKAVERWFLYNRRGENYASQTPEEYWKSYIMGTKIYK